MDTTMAEAGLVKGSDEPQFYEQGRDWEMDSRLRIEQSERRAWWVAGIACVVALGLGIGLACLAPLKSTIPYVFTVDRATGNVEFVSAADDRTVRGYQELLDKHWTQKYVLARESYYFRLLQTDYDQVLSMSADAVGRDYARIYDGPKARDKTLGPGMEWKVKVLSVTLHADAVGFTATVRCEKTPKRTEAETSDPPQYFIATLAYEYRTSMKGQEKDLIQNPLGFKVTSYRVDAEIGTVSPAGPMAMLERS